MDEHFRAMALKLAQALTDAGVSLDAPADEIKAAVKEHPAFTNMGRREFGSVVSTMRQKQG